MPETLEVFCSTDFFDGCNYKLKPRLSFKKAAVILSNQYFVN